MTLVGYSLGGVYARELARANPAKVERVITLAAPFGLRDDKGAPDAAVAILYNYGQGHAPSAADVLAPPPVPTISFYSRADRVVPWQASQSAPTPQSVNIAVAPGLWPCLSTAKRPPWPSSWHRPRRRSEKQPRGPASIFDI